MLPPATHPKFHIRKVSSQSLVPANQQPVGS